jgi:hypothetical protein
MGRGFFSRSKPFRIDARRIRPDRFPVPLTNGVYDGLHTEEQAARYIPRHDCRKPLPVALAPQEIDACPIGEMS